MFKLLNYIILFCLLSASLATGTEVPLNLREQYNIQRSGAPMTVGIPLPKGTGITNINNLRINDTLHNEIYAQFRILQRWGGLTSDTTKEIKWILADFQADVGAANNAIYYLEYGTHIQKSTDPNPLNVSVTVNEITVDTGAAIFKIDRLHFNLFKSVIINGQEFINPTQHSGSVVTDSFDEKYYADNNTTSVVVEEEGPERIVIKAIGFHQNESGTDSSFYGYTTRMYFYKGKSTVKVDHTLENVPLIPRGALAFKDFSLFLDLNLDNGDKSYMIFGDAKRTGNLTSADHEIKIYQGSDGTDYWNDDGLSYDVLNSHAQFRGYKIFKDSAEIENHNYALGILDISDQTKGVTVTINQFWQRYPKKLQVTRDGALTVGLLPEEFSTEGNYNYFIEDMSKLNTEIYFDFHQGAYSTTAENEILNMLHPIVPTADPSWYAKASAAALPPGTIFYDPSGVKTTEGTLDDIIYPLINLPSSYGNKRASQGFYSAFSYGPYEIGDNAQTWKPPTHSDQFMKYMRIGVPGASGDKYQYKMTGYPNANPFANDYDLFCGGVDFVKHFIYSRAGSSPLGQTFDSLNIKNRWEQKAYYFECNYPTFGGRVAIDPTHTLSTLIPQSAHSGHPAQPTRRWYLPEGMHIYVGGVVDYYHLTGDMAAKDWLTQFGETCVNYLSWDIKQHGSFTGYYDDGAGHPNTPVTPGVIRSFALPIADMMFVYSVVEDPKFLHYAEEQAKIFDRFQDKNRGFYDTTSAMSLGQIDRLMWAFIQLYDVTGNEKYFDLIEGYNNGIYYYIRNRDTNFADTYNCYDSDGNMLSYAAGMQYFDSYHHQVTRTPAYAACESSNRRIMYMYAWMSRMTGDPIYRTLIDPCYDIVTHNNPSWQTDLAELTLYLYDRYDNPKADTTSPTKVSNLTATNMGNGNWKLEWITPTDNIGLFKYQIKYAEKPMVNQIIYPDQKDSHVNFWAAANVDNEPVPGVPGSQASMTVTGLDPGKAYIFAIRTYDTSNNRSAITLSSGTSPGGPATVIPQITNIVIE